MEAPGDQVNSVTPMDSSIFGVAAVSPCPDTIRGSAPHTGIWRPMTQSQKSNDNAVISLYTK